MSFPKGNLGVRCQCLSSWPIWSYWLAWTAVVVVDAASYRPAEYQLWLISPYAWWIAPIVLWWTIPRNTSEYVSIAWSLFILTWAAWRVLSLAYESIDPWSFIADDSSFRLLQLPLKAAVVGAVLAIAFSGPVVRIAGGLAGRAAFVVGLVASAMTIGPYLPDVDGWLLDPMVNAMEVFDALLIALLLAASTPSIQLTSRFQVEQQKASTAWAAMAPRIAGFPSIFAIAALSMFGAVLAWEPSNNTWLRIGIAVGAGMFPIVFVTRAGIRAWRRLGVATRGRPISSKVSAIAGRGGVLLATCSLWLELIWVGAPFSGSEVVESLRSIPGPLWSVRTDPSRQAIVLSGELGPGVATAVQIAVHSNQQLRFLWVSSPGGLVGEARVIAQIVKSRGLITVVSAECESACATILASGAERWLIEGGAVGLHSESALGLPIEYEDTDHFDLLSSLNGSALLARREASVPYWDMWYPTEEELIASALVTRVMTVEQYQQAVVDYVR